jgi:hypothetical protein
MSIRTSFNNLEITGNLMEVPPPKEPTLIRATVDRSKIKPFALNANNTRGKRPSLPSVSLSNNSNSNKLLNSANRSMSGLSEESNQNKTKISSQDNHKSCQVTENL